MSVLERQYWQSTDGEDPNLLDWERMSVTVTCFQLSSYAECGNTSLPLALYSVACERAQS